MHHKTGVPITVISDAVLSTEIVECNNVGNGTCVEPHIIHESFNRGFLMDRDGPSIGLKGQWWMEVIDGCDKFWVAEDVNGRLAVKEDNIM